MWSRDRARPAAGSSSNGRGVLMAGFGVVSSRLYAWFTRNPSSVRAVVDFADLRDGDRVLDVGCGAGGGVDLAAQRLGAGSVAAVDPSETFVRMVRRRVPGADVRVSGAESVPFDDAAFSVIYAVASMHHWDDRDSGLATLVRKLAAGGRLLLAERALASPGHGITAGQTREVVETLSRLGQGDVSVVERRAGRRLLTIIASSRPGDADA